MLRLKYRIEEGGKKRAFGWYEMWISQWNDLGKELVKETAFITYKLCR